MKIYYQNDTSSSRQYLFADDPSLMINYMSMTYEIVFYGEDHDLRDIYFTSDGDHVMWSLKYSGPGMFAINERILARKDFINAMEFVGYEVEIIDSNTSKTTEFKTCAGIPVFEGEEEYD